MDTHTVDAYGLAIATLDAMVSSASFVMQNITAHATSGLTRQGGLQASSATSLVQAGAPLTLAGLGSWYMQEPMYEDVPRY